MEEKTKNSLDLEQLIEEHADMVYRIAYVQMKQKSDAEDVFQEVFLRLVNNITSLKNAEHAKAWLIRVTINCCHKQYNTAWRKKTASMEESQFAEESMVKDEAVEDLLEACWELPEAQRIVIHLFYLEGYSIKDMSRLLEQSETAIKTRLSRAREALRNKMKGDLINEGRI